MKNAVVLNKHRSKFLNPLILSKGDIVKTGNEDKEFPGWIWCTTSDNNSGWISQTYLEINKNSAVLKKDYNATELNVDIGQILKVFFEDTDWAWCEAEDSLKGWVPVNKIKYLN